MSLEQIYDSNMEAIETQQLEAVAGQYRGQVPQVYNSTFETFIASIKEPRTEVIEALWAFYRDWLARDLATNLVKFYPILGGNGLAERYVEFFGGTSLAVAGGDASYAYDGIKGDGAAVRYTTGLNFSTLISDAQNFTVALTSMTDDDSGTDFGANDGTNHVSIACKNSGTCTMKAGTVTVTGTPTKGNGVFLLNVNAGAVIAYQVVDRALIQLNDTPGTMAGSLPATAPLLCAENNNGTPANYSQKKIKNLVIYNGALDASGVVLLGFGLTELNMKLNTADEYET